MDTIQGLYNPNGRLNVENGLNTKLTGWDGRGRGRGIGAMDADSGNVEWHTTDRDLSHGFGKRDGEIGRRASLESRTKWNTGRARAGGAFQCIQ